VDELRFVSLAAESAAELWRAVTGHLERQLAIRVQIVEDVPWQARERMLYRGEAHVGVVCGLQYVHATDRGGDPGVELVAAPIMRGTRYQNRPIYFSDVVVRNDCQAGSLVDLRGATWAVNEPTSQSGFNITRYALAARGETSAFFGRVVESGAHERSIELLLNGAVDATAIDSTVLEALRPDVRVIETLGPSPIPPLVASRLVPRELRDALANALLGLSIGPVETFVCVADADYEPIRTMARIAERLPSWTLARPQLPKSRRWLER
jgi:phosphonate transport system substrate-binding protein